MKKKTILGLVAVVVILAIGAFFIRKPVSKQEQSILEQPILATFICKNGSFIKANFYNKGTGSVNLVLSDGRHLTLPQAVSASGARYANKDEGIVFWNKGDTAFIEENGKTTYDDCQTKDNSPTESRDAKTSLANPASVNCVQKGGIDVIKNKPDGSQYGLCFFEDNMACEEWAMLRGECPVNGVKITGYDTEAQKFCAWSGGKTLAAKDAICTFNDGSVCTDEAFYTGICQKGTKSGTSK